MPVIALAGSGTPLSAQTLVNQGAAITVTPGATITIRGDVTNSASGIVDNSGTINISGSTVNDGVINAPAPSSLIFDGTSTQVLGGSSPILAKDVIVNNAAGVTLATPLRVDGAMTFTDGVVTATNNAAPVIFSASGTVSGTPTDASHVDGYVQKEGTGAFTFPVGDAARYQPVEMDISANGSGVTARYHGADAGLAPFGVSGSSATPLLYYNTKEYWDLVPVSSATGTVTILYDDYNNSGIGNIADLRIAHLSGGEWLNEGGTASGSTSSGAITSGSISSFSPFTLGSVSSATPLPVKLVVFSGKPDNVANRLDWKTATEDAGTTFVIERSTDGSSFASIGGETGKGSNSSYTVYDRQPASLSYYRLKVHAPGDAARYSQTVMIRNGGNSAAQVVVYPVPATSTLTINSAGSSLAGTTATLQDAQGKSLASIRLEGLNRVDIAAWPAGIYTLRLADGTAMKILKK